MKAQLWIAVIVLCCAVVLCSSLPQRGQKWNNKKRATTMGVAASQCSKSSPPCSNKGDVCNFTLCVANQTQCCAMGLDCVNGLCAVTDPTKRPSIFGTTCNASDPMACFPEDSDGTIGWTCKNSVCIELVNPNDRCDIPSSECIGKSTCSGGVCQGVAVGGQCTGSDCDWGLVCDYRTQMCVTVEGRNCSYDGDCGNMVWSCSGGKCTKPFTISAGSSCSSNPDGCDPDSMCINGQCMSYDESDLFKTCSSNSDCATNFNCSGCDTFTGDQLCIPEANIQICGAEQMSYNDCAEKYKCMDLSLRPDRCSGINCFSEAKKVQYCGCELSVKMYAGCTYEYACSVYASGLVLWQIILIAVGCCICVTITVALVVVVIRRRRHHHHGHSDYVPVNTDHHHH